MNVQIILLECLFCLLMTDCKQSVFMSTNFKVFLKHDIWMVHIKEIIL